MSLFKTIKDVMAPGGVVTLTIRLGKDDRLTVIAAAEQPGLSDAARHLIPPFKVTGTAEELDAELPGILAEPVRKTTGLLSNMKEVEEGLKKAEAVRKKEDDEKAAADREADRKATDKVNALLKEAEDLFKKKDWKAAKAKYDEAEKAATEAKKSFLFNATAKKNRDAAAKNAAAQPTMFDFNAFGANDEAPADGDNDKGPEDPEEEPGDPEATETEEED